MYLAIIFPDKFKNLIAECLDELAVRRLFVFLKENLNFEDLQDEFISRRLLSERECKDYVFTAHGKHHRNAKFLKLMITQDKCNKFVGCMQSLPCHEHINEKIREFKNIEIQTLSKGNTYRYNVIYMFFSSIA